MVKRLVEDRARYRNSIQAGFSRVSLQSEPSVGFPLDGFGSFPSATQEDQCDVWHQAISSEKFTEGGDIAVRIVLRRHVSSRGDDAD